MFKSDILCFSVVVKASAAGIIGKADSVAMVAGCERVAVCITRARHLLYGSFHAEPEFRLSLRLCFCSDIAACGMRASALAMVAHSGWLWFLVFWRWRYEIEGIRFQF